MKTLDILTLTLQNFDSMAVQSPIPVFIEFWSDEYSKDCRMTGIMEALEKKYADSIRLGSINVEQQPQLSCQLGVGGVPSVLILYNGRIRAHIGGAHPRRYYEQLINRLLSEEVSRNEKHKELLFK